MWADKFEEQNVNTDILRQIIKTVTNKVVTHNITTKPEWYHENDNYTHGDMSCRGSGQAFVNGDCISTYLDNFDVYQDESDEPDHDYNYIDRDSGELEDIY